MPVSNAATFKTKSKSGRWLTKSSIHSRTDMQEDKSAHMRGGEVGLEWIHHSAYTPLTPKLIDEQTPANVNTISRQPYPFSSDRTSQQTASL